MESDLPDGPYSLYRFIPLSLKPGVFRKTAMTNQVHGIQSDAWIDSPATLDRVLKALGKA
jgi:hypothetical protein